MQEYIEEIIKEIGEDPQRKGLLKTPLRVEQSLRFLTSGYRMDINDILNEALFEEKYDEMIIVKNIDIFSLCEHHLAGGFRFRKDLLCKLRIQFMKLRILWELVWL